VRIGPTGVLVTDAPANTDAWYAARHEGIGSSEIAVLLGLSPYSSPFDLWWHKRNREVVPANDAMRWGTRLEPVIIDAWSDEHPDLALRRSPGVIMHADRPWQRASPDALAYEGQDWTDPIALLECKSDNNRAGWGEPGTDEIPPHYLAQVRWQLDTLGLGVGFVAVTFGGPPLEYVVGHDEADAVLMREKAQEFLASLERDTPPPIDAHHATTRRLKALHPSVEDVEVEIPADLIEARREADDAVKAATADRDRYDNTIRDLLGDARAGTVDGEVAVTRSVFDTPEKTITRSASTTHRLNFRRPKRESAA
jgi:putative phage-type endonuclease